MTEVNVVLLDIKVLVVRVNCVAVLNYNIGIHATTGPCNVDRIAIVEHFTDLRLVDGDRKVVTREGIARGKCQSERQVSLSDTCHF